MEILSLGEKIKRKRKELNMTLKDLAGDRITPGQISLVESGKSNPSMDLLEYLADNLNTSVEYLMESEESQAQKICKYFSNMAKAYLLGDDIILSEEYLEKALYYASKYSLPLVEAEAHYIRGKIYLQKKEYSTAQQYFLDANSIFMKHNSYGNVIKTLLSLGLITLKLKAYHSCSTYFQQAEKLYYDNNIGDDYLIGEIYYFTAYNYFKLDDMEKVKIYSKLAEDKFKLLYDKKSYAKSLLNKAEEYGAREDMENAIKYSEKSLTSYSEFEQDKDFATMENDLGKLFSYLDDFDRAFKHLEKARELRENQRDYSYIDTLINICENHIKLKNIEKSKAILNIIREEASSRDELSMIKYYLLKYRVDLQEENEIEAENTLIMALTFANNLNYYKEAGEISMTLGNFYIGKGNIAEAAKYLNEGVELFKKINVIKDI